MWKGEPPVRGHPVGRLRRRDALERHLQAADPEPAVTGRLRRPCRAAADPCAARQARDPGDVHGAGAGRRRAPGRLRRDRRARPPRGRLPRLLPRERARAADRGGARADEAGHRAARGDVRQPPRAATARRRLRSARTPPTCSRSSGSPTTRACSATTSPTGRACRSRAGPCATSSSCPSAGSSTTRPTSCSASSPTCRGSPPRRRCWRSGRPSSTAPTASAAASCSSCTRSASAATRGSPCSTS